VDFQKHCFARNQAEWLSGSGNDSRSHKVTVRSGRLRRDEEVELLMFAGDVRAGSVLMESGSGGIHFWLGGLLEATSQNLTLNILVVHEAFPDGKSRADMHLMQVIRVLRQQGCAVTFIAREKTNRASFEAEFKTLGIETYEDDIERLISLGGTVEDDSDWALPEILREGKFDIAILAEGTRQGLSISEQYLDDLRSASANTRIVILASDLLRTPLASRFDTSGKLAEYEIAQDHLQRQQESFARADAVMVSSEDDAENLIVSGCEAKVIVLPAFEEVPGSGMRSWASLLADGIDQASKLPPKPVNPTPCSAMRIEKLFSARLANNVGEERVRRQLECHVMLAEQLLREKKPTEAREQLRHALSNVRKSQTCLQFVAQVFVMLKRCYRELGEMEMAEWCASAARQCVIAGIKPSSRPHAAKHSHLPVISVIVPTYNRLPILEKCLSALEMQTLAKAKFEVLVIDDGSSDGTEEAMRQRRPSFAFRYLRQPNSGTGTARCNGVAHAKGEYLLLMNDDTICHAHVLQEHLQAHRRYGADGWAVLGNFQYPAAARQRVLTHYFCVEPFMFPQVSMEDGCPYAYSHFITCNLSIRRDAVLEAGSFDPTYRLSEDTELGIRLFERGYRVLYHPAAHAWHDHLPYSIQNLIRRARVYGQDYFYMFRRHPRVMKEWALPVPLTGMDEENAGRVLEYIERNRQSVEQAVLALERWDAVDFEPFLSGGDEMSTLVLSLFRQAVPAVHWFYLFETMFQTMTRELKLAMPHAGRAPTLAAAGGIG
jgi:GT2 family glycosyltransferase